ncbi:response regulator transcription factor, partial [bacterium]|nr:response regulator transcription factor [bacterium]
MRVLLVEDEPNVAAFVKKGLAEEGFSVDHAKNREDGLHMGTRESYDVLVVDRRLPDGDGVDLVREVRGRGVGTPILVLSALADLEARVAGLDAGADDYLAKPFAFTELVARVRALLRRGRAPLPAVLKAGDLELDPAKRKVLSNGARLDLTPREFALLHLFLRYKGATLSRTTIGEHVWDYNFDSFSNVIDVYV